MKDSVLVTGGAGYIGSVVVAQLLARGYPVVVLDDLSRGHRAAVAPEATFVQGGVGDRAALDALLRSHRCHALVHLAAYALVGESVAEPEMYRANNVTAGRVLLERAAAAGVRRVVFSSSCAVYGHPSVTPIPEDAPLAPVNPYGETKRDFERVLADYARADGASVVNLRYFNAAGATARARCGGGAGGNDPRLAAAALQSGGDPRERVGLAPGAPAWVRELGRTDIVLFQVGRAVPTTPWELVLTSSRETKFVLAILVVFSIVSWYLIFLKWWQFRRMRRQADRFMAEIERATRLDDAYHAAMRLPASPYNRLLREGIHFFSELKPGGLKDNGPAVATQTALTTTQLEALRMVLAKEVAAERDAAARFLPWLATFGSVSPLLGLLGGGGGGLRGHGELPLNADINVTSLVDVAFVLLIIFMITAPIMQGGVDVRLPRAEARPLEPKSGLVVTLDREGRIFMDQAPLSYEDFRATFPAFVRTKRPTGVYLRADGRVPYADVVQVLAVIRAAGVNDVGLVAEPEVVQR